ncbi:MAG TPA: diacylglycerol kinase family protein [Bacteroidales bacterium]
MDSLNTTKTKIAFIINPKSGTNKKHNLPEIITEVLDQSKFQTDFLFTKCAGHATELAKQLIVQGYKRIVAAGGDGTVNEVARSLVNTDVVLGILPCGSGNGLARFLKIPMKLKEAIALQGTGSEISIDFGLINDNPFFCTCGVGFDAHIGNKFAQSHKRGFFTYVKETVKAFFNYKPKKYKIKVDGEKLKTRAFLITVANAGQYGNDAYIAPQADITDGMLDLCILTPFPKHKAFHLGYRLFNRTMDRCSYIKVRKGQTITIKRKKKGEVHLDGEPAIMGKKLKIRIVEKGLKVIIPE